MNFKISIYAFLTSVLSAIAFKHLLKGSVGHRGIFHGYDLLLLFSFLVLGYFVFYTIISKLFVWKGTSKIYNVAFIILALLFLLLPLTKINNNTISPTENRKLQIFPNLIVNNAFNYNYGKQFEAWLNDHFRGREKVIKYNNRVEVFLTGRIENDRAMEGKDSWLFYKGEGSIAKYQNKANFSDEQLLNFKKRLENKRDFCESLGASYYILIAPDKSKVYGEFYPNHYKKKVANFGQGEQLSNYIKQNSDVKIIYPLPQLLAAKSNNEVYFKNDTHWNNVGAFVGYQELIRLIATDYNDLKILQWSDFNVRKYETGGDLQNMLMLKGRKYTSETLDFKNDPSFKRENIQDKKGIVAYKGREYVVTHNDSSKYKVLVFRDSFSSALIPYLSQQFAHVEYIWTRDFEKNKKLIEEIKPDIVIEETVERATGALTR